MKKKLEELNLLDDFLFGTLISHPVYRERFARILIKTILNRDIKILKIIPQMNYFGQDTDRHGTRLDVYIEEEGYVVQGDVQLSSIYDIEPDQNSNETARNALPRRVRFYRSTIDTRNLQSGAAYNRLKNIIIIMLLPYDPFGYDRMVYTVKNMCLEEPEMEFDDGALNLFIYTRGKTGVIPQELKELLQYLENTTWNNAVNEPLREVQRMVDKVKYDKEVSISYMKSYERDWMMRNEGLATGRLEGEYIRLIKTLKDFLSDLGTIPEKIMTRIDNETDITILERWMKLAAKSDSIEAFIERM
ncbi:MAG: hypothetical protein HDR05_06280 [Lachnospiraceae bacterium]|nr:hypothetical protein [Lachnospiraceae bacterium]